jgi:transposase-like protein
MVFNFYFTITRKYDKADIKIFASKGEYKKMNCPNCQGEKIIKYGKIHNGKQRFECKECGRQFVENPKNKIIDNKTIELIDRLLLEKLPLAGIVRVTGVSESWLQNYVNKKYEEIPKEVKVKEKSKYRLTIE